MELPEHSLIDRGSNLFISGIFTLPPSKLFKNIILFFSEVMDQRKKLFENRDFHVFGNIQKQWLKIIPQEKTKNQKNLFQIGKLKFP